MTPNACSKFENIYRAALEQQPGRRSAFLARTCGEDEDLRREVESLFAHSGESTASLAKTERAGRMEARSSHRVHGWDRTRLSVLWGGVAWAEYIGDWIRGWTAPWRSKSPGAVWQAL